MLKRVFQTLMIIIMAIYLFSCGGSGFSNEDSTNSNVSQEPINEHIVFLNILIEKQDKGKPVKLQVFDKENNLISEEKISGYNIKYFIEKDILNENKTLIFKLITSSGKELYGVYFLSPTSTSVNISKYTTTAYFIAKYTEDKNFDSFLEFLPNLASFVSSDVGNNLDIGNTYRYKDIYERLFPIVRDYLENDGEYPSKKIFFSLIPDKSVQISENELKNENQKIEKLIKYNNDILKISFDKEKSEINGSLNIKVLDTQTVEFLGENFNIYKVDVGDNILRDIEFYKINSSDKNIKITSIQNVDFCDNYKKILIQQLRAETWLADGSISRKICQIINWDKTGFDYKTNIFKLVLNSYDITSLILIEPKANRKEYSNDGITLFYTVSNNEYFELTMYLYKNEQSNDSGIIGPINIPIFVFSINSVNDQIRAKASDSIIAYKTLKETRANPKYDNEKDHWNNMVNSNEFKWSITTNEVVTHRILDFDKVLGKGINTIWDKTDYAKKVNQYKNNDDRIPLILIHGWQGDKDLRNPAKLGLWKYSELQYFQHLLDYYLTNEYLQKHYHVYLYHYTTYKHVTYNAYILEELLNEIKNKYPNSSLARGLADVSKGVVIIGHSMGGLVSRSLIEEHKGLGQNAEYLRKLITLDTPHHGSVVAENFIPNNIPKDLGTHGAFDLNWDNFDGAYDDSFINKNNRENRWIGDASVRNFDTYYWEISSKKRSTANPYLLYLNELLKNDLALYKDKYIFYVAWNVNSFTLSPSNLFENCFGGKLAAFYSNDPFKIYNLLTDADFIDNGCMDASTIEIGSKTTDSRPNSYSAGGAEPVGSAFLADENSKGGLFDPYRSEIGVSVSLIDNLINIFGFNIYKLHPYGIPYRLFWDYDHEKIVNGAYSGDKGSWDRYIFENGNEYTAFKDFRTRIKYINVALKYYFVNDDRNIQFDENADPNEIPINPLKFEPVFWVLAKDLYDISGIVINNPPVANSFTADKVTANLGDTITFSYDVSDPDGDSLTCEFDFDGDGNIDRIVSNCSSGRETYTYLDQGSFSPELVVYDGVEKVRKFLNILIEEDMDNSPVAYYEFNNGFYNEVTQNDDSNLWIDSAKVDIVNSSLKLINNYDGDPKREIYTLLDTSNIEQLIIEKKTKLLPKDDYFIGSTTVEDSLGNIVSITYNNYHYNNGDLSHTILVENTEHFYIFNRWNLVDANNFEYKISPLINPIWNEWFYERITVDYTLNEVKYEISKDRNVYQTVYISDVKLTQDKNTKITFSAWDWGSGSEHLVNYLKIYKIGKYDNYSNNIDKNGLIAYYSFDNCDATDNSGNRNDGTINGTPECVNGISGNAFKFGGYYDPDYIEVPNSTSLSFVDNFSFVLWFNVQDVYGMGGWGDAYEFGKQTMIAKSGDREGLNIGLYQDINNPGTFKLLIHNGRCCSSDSHSLSVYSKNEISNIKLNEWHMVAVVADGTYIRIYVDGVLKAIESLEVFNINPLMSQSPLRIGIDEWAIWYPFSGIIDEVRIYNRALTEGEIIDLFLQN